MNSNNLRLLVRLTLVLGTFGAGLLASPSKAQTTPPTGQPQGSRAATTFHPNRTARRAAAYYGLTWGIEAPTVKSVESGEIIKFTYHVIDADKAKALNDKKAEPVLVDPQAGVSLVIPSLEKVGKLRQTSTPEAGKSYWMAFSNKGGLVKRGDHVNIVIGLFHADGLIVD